MTFKRKMILTGIDPNKVSKKTGQPYCMLYFLNENGSTFGSMLASDVKIPEGLKQLSTVNVEFEVTFYNGNVSGLRTIDINLAA